MPIRIQEKPATKPLGPDQLTELRAYRVVEVPDDFNEVEVGDIVLRFPCNTGGAFVLNCTREKMLFDTSRTSPHQWRAAFRCERAHDIERISFVVDQDDPPPTNP